MNFLGFFLTKTLAEREGIASDRATELGLVTSLLPGPMGLVMGIVAAQRETPPPSFTTSTTTDRTEAGSTTGRAEQTGAGRTGAAAR